MTVLQSKPLTEGESIALMSAAAFRQLERQDRERRYEAALAADPKAEALSAPDDALGFTLTDDELREAKRWVNECLADLRAGVPLRAALDRAYTPLDADEDFPIAPWLTMPAAQPAAGDGEEESDEPSNGVAKQEVPASRPRIGRPAGSSNMRRGPRPKLDGEAVRRLRDDRAGGMTFEAVCAKYGVSRTTAHNLANGAAHAPQAAPVVPQPQPPPVALKSLPGPALPRLRDVQRAPAENARARFVAWIGARTAGATRRDVVAAGIFPLESTDTHLNKLRLQGRIVRRGHIWFHRDAPKENDMVAKERRRPGPKPRGKPGPKPRPRLTEVASHIEAVSGDMSVSAMLAKLRQEVADRQAAILVLEVLVGK